MRRKNKQNEEEYNFWQPASDMFSALMLMFMLIILLLGLYLIQIPEEDEIDPDPGAMANVTYEPGATEHADWQETHEPDGGEGDGTQTPEPTPTPTPTPTPPSGTGPGDDDQGKAAVYVMLIDAETDRTIKEAGVVFELYEQEGTLQVLNTYYPERISFRNYETTELGTFYFPEKLIFGDYYVHELTEASGYDTSENQAFSVYEAYDWPEPYVVRVPVYPSKNIVRINCFDSASRLAVTGGTYNVVAAEDIFTADETLRYRAGEIVDEIVCDENGYGESKELYLGNYLVRQSTIAPYYAGLEEDREVVIEKKTNVQPELNDISCEKTTLNVTLADELYDTRGISDATFVLSSDSGRWTPMELKTDSTGSFTVDTLEKNMTYSLRQMSTGEGYVYRNEDVTFNVTSDGRIEGESTLDLTVTNRLIRVALGITDEFSSVQVADINLALYNDKDELIRTWTSSGSALTINGLTPGAYYIVREGNTDRHYDITIQDVAEVQNINIHTTYIMQYVLIGGGIALGVGAVALAYTLLNNRRKKKQAQNIVKAG